MNDYSTEVSDKDEEVKQDQSDEVTFSKTEEPQSTPKKVEAYNLLKSSMSHSVTSKIKFARKEEFKVVLEHWNQFKSQHFRAII